MSLGSRRRARRILAAAAVAAGLSPGPALAQARQWRALPVAGGTDAVSAAAGLPPGLPAWRVLYEAARRRHGLWGEDVAGVATGAPAGPGAPPGPAVALPLSPDLWRRLLRRADLPDERLALALLADRRSSLLYRGLAAFDEPTLASLAGEPDALRRIHARHAGVLAAFGARFRVGDGGVVVPGGAEAEPLWQELVGASPREPVRFLRALLAANGGRRAFLYDAVARLDPPRQRFALGMQHAPGPARAEAARALAAVFDGEGAWWRGEGGAFTRPDVDAARLLREVRVAADGGLAPPAARRFWEAVFEDRPLAGAERAEEPGASPRADAAWLAERVATGAPSARCRRFEQLAFAQRVFGETRPAALPEAVVAARSLPHARAALLALERMGTREPILYGRVAGVARRAAAGGGDTASVLRGLQGGLAVIDRARFARTLDVEEAEGLVGSLLEVPVAGEGRGRALAAWVEGTLLPGLARAVYGARPPGDPDTTVLRAMAGDTVETGEDAAAFEWEGLWYRADPGRAELVRLERVRARQGGMPLAAALDACRSPAGTGGDPCAGALGSALASIVYAAHLGDPEGPALAGEDVSLRHDFGADPWALPEEVAGPGVPWHVRGSLLGLERALARLALRRLAGDELPEEPPVIEAAQRRALAVPAALVNPRELTDEDRDAAAAAIEAGRRRVAALRPRAAEAGAVGSEAGLDPWRVRALEWLLEHDPPAAGGFFSLGELLRLGAPGEERWDAWGVADELVTGLRPRLPGPRPLDETAGRAPQPALAAGFCDLSLRVAVHLSERRLPAALGPALASTLLAGLFDEARPLAPDDRLALDAWVRAQPRERLDDAVASLAGRGTLQPAPSPGGER